MTSPGKVQMNLRVAPAVRDSANAAAVAEGLSLNLWAEKVLEEAAMKQASSAKKKVTATG